MGLERLAAVLQHVHSNYEIDLFQAPAGGGTRDAVEPSAATRRSTLQTPSLKVIADHIRACAFTITDGVIPGNEGRGYVLRRIARRAIRHGYKLGARKPFFHTLVAPLAAEMGEAYPELRRDAVRVTEVLKAGGGALLPDHRPRHGDPRRRARPGRAPPSTARPPSSCTTPSASRST
jgi:alanyl-tRNA synthetase